jgi:peptide/nickel transport system ATP-binding protein
LPSPTSGSIKLDNSELTGLSGEELRKMRPRMQMIFQDPISSLNPRRKVVDIVAEPLKIWSVGTKEEQLDKVRRVLDTVGIDVDQAGTRKPHEFSGGQCQRICIARAVVMEPKVIICDEPVSALDVSVQAQILNLLEDMKKEYGLTLVFIAHDLAVVKNISDRVVVMYLGKICEVGPPDALYAEPRHHYTRALIDSIPEADPTKRPDETSALEGDLPSPMAPPSGCRFRTRCPAAQDRCAQDEPILQQVGDGHFVACHFPIGIQNATSLSVNPALALG